MSPVLILIVCCSFLAAASDKSKEHDLPPDKFIIGRDTFFDFGPPFHYLEVISVAAQGKTTGISRALITPPGHPCSQPAQIEVRDVSVSETVSDLLEGGNPCAIPDRELHREQKRCKHCLTFSGVDVVMQVECNGVPRHLRMDILDRDIYDRARSNTPAQTAWTMRLLNRLDAAIGAGAMEKPIFSAGDVVSPPSSENGLLREIAAGHFDDLFPGTTLKLSDVYKEAMHPPPRPVHIVSADPAPTSGEPPLYPPLARAAHVSGRVRFTGTVGADGHLSGIQVEGQPLLKPSVAAAIATWSYSNAAIGAAAAGVIEFRDNCASQQVP